MEKNELRDLARKKRMECVGKEEKSEEIAKSVLNLIEDKQVIALYVSKNDEVDTHGLIKKCLELGKDVVVPKVVGKSVIFVQIHSMDELEKGAFDLLEPISSDAFDLTKIEIVIVPMVGFDALKHRIGYGKGYYDSVLDQIDCMHVGIAFACQQVENFVCSSHDIPMDIILTEYSEFN